MDTLDSIVKDLQLSEIRLIKMDVEGYEPEVLSGSNKTLRCFGSIVCFEVIDSYHKSSCRAMEYLQIAGYRMNYTFGGMEGLTGVRNIVALDRSANSD